MIISLLYFVSDSNPLTVNIGNDTYQIGNVAIDTINVSTTEHGFSGTLRTVSGNFSIEDGTEGNQVEAILVMPSAAARIITSYVPSADMPPKNLSLLMGLDMKAGTVVYQTTVGVTVGASVLTFAGTTGISANQPISGPNIVLGTTATAVTSTTITLSTPTIGIIPPDRPLRSACQIGLMVISYKRLNLQFQILTWKASMRLV